MDDKYKKLDFADFITVDHAQMNDDLIAYRRKRLKNGAMHEEVDEALTHSQRMKASQRMKKMSRRIQMAKKRAMKRAPSMDVLKKRAQKNFSFFLCCRLFASLTEWIPSFFSCLLSSTAG